MKMSWNEFKEGIDRAMDELGHSHDTNIDMIDVVIKEEIPVDQYEILIMEFDGNVSIFLNVDEEGK